MSTQKRSAADQEKLNDILIAATKMRDRLQSASSDLMKTDLLLKEAEDVVREVLSGRLRLVITRPGDGD